MLAEGAISESLPVIGPIVAIKCPLLTMRFGNKWQDISEAWKMQVQIQVVQILVQVQTQV